MKLILIRHGESQANIDGVLSSRAEDAYLMTKNGVRQIMRLAGQLKNTVDVAYVSPLRRTLQTSDILFSKSTINPIIIIDSRIKEIDYGIFSGQKNNPELDRMRKMQVAGDLKIKFGESGENKFEIMDRLYDILIDILSNSAKDSTVAIISHGSITGWIERILLGLEGKTSNHKHINNGDIREYFLNENSLDKIKLLRLNLIDEYNA